MSASDGTKLQSDQTVSIVGTDTTGVVTNAVNATVNGLAVDPSAVQSPVKLNDSAGTAITLGQKAMTASLPVVIASDQSSVPVLSGVAKVVSPTALTDGTKTALATLPNTTLSTSSIHQLYSQWGQGFTVTTDILTIVGTTETPILYINNPSASGKTIKVRYFDFGSPSNNNTYSLYKVYINPTITANGTAVTPIGNRQTSQNASVAQVFKNPTTSLNGSLKKICRVTGNGGDLRRDEDYAFWVEPGNRALVSVTLSATNLNAHCVVEFCEE